MECGVFVIKETLDFGEFHEEKIFDVFKSKESASDMLNKIERSHREDYDFVNQRKRYEVSREGDTLKCNELRAHWSFTIIEAVVKF